MVWFYVDLRYYALYIQYLHGSLTWRTIICYISKCLFICRYQVAHGFGDDETVLKEWASKLWFFYSWWWCKRTLHTVFHVITIEFKHLIHSCVSPWVKGSITEDPESPSGGSPVPLSIKTSQVSAMAWPSVDTLMPSLWFAGVWMRLPTPNTDTNQVKFDNTSVGKITVSTNSWKSWCEALLDFNCCEYVIQNFSVIIYL